ncbi:MAG: TonB-dependent receptor [Candidatus Baltobacteraceae bacterium]
MLSIRRWPRVAAAVLTCALLSSAPLTAWAGAPATIAGVVDDAQSGLPLSGATVSAVGTSLHASTDRSGGFALPPIPAGTYRLRVERDGYQPTLSDPVSAAAGATVEVTLTVQAAPNASALKTIANTSTRATESLQRSSTIYRTLSPETLLETGTWRFGDALRELPGVQNSIAGDTAALGDDLQLEIRGLGPSETTATLDGHPIGFGIPSGFNYQLSPSFGLKNVTVYYGSGGTDLSGYDAIGGIVDWQTIDPTPDQRIIFTQGAGTFSRALTNLTVTGTTDRLGYALSAGVAGLDGPYKNDYFYQPGAAYDPSATNPAVRNLAVYRDDSTAVSRDFVGKLRYSLSDATHLTFTSVNSDYWEDKTGNGDADYYTPQYALALGQNLLANKSAKDTCPAGEFTATNANGVPWGTGPNGLPDGGSACQTPASYANDVTGLQGAGPAWQAFNFNDQALHFDTGGARHTLRVDGFTDRYLDTVDRTFRLPFKAVYGDDPSWRNYAVDTTGVSASDDLYLGNHQLGFGYEYTNFAYKLQSNGALKGAPIVNETNFFLREAYRPNGSPFSAYLSAYFKHATTTNTSYVDPRLSGIYTAPRGNDVVRASLGATTAQPPANDLNQAFTPSSLVTAGGGGGFSCAKINSVGSVPSSELKPERGVDEELSYGHRFSGDSQVQVAFYNTNVFNKIYSTTTALAQTGTGFIDPATLAAAMALASSNCGNVNPLTVLGVTGPINLGQLRAQGFTVSGRERVLPQLFFDYDYATTSTTIQSASPLFYQQNLTYIQGAQLPRVPLHTFNVSADGTPAKGLDVRYTLHWVSANNSKSLPPYSYSDLRLTSRAGPGNFTVAVSNLFNQNAFIDGLMNAGQPLALNQYATAASYAAETGASATELFGLPYRSIYFSYAWQIR